MVKENGITEAIRAVGGQEKLAELMGVSQQAISKWHKQGYAPSKRLVELEAQTGVNRLRLMGPRLADLVGDE